MSTAPMTALVTVVALAVVRAQPVPLARLLFAHPVKDPFANFDATSKFAFFQLFHCFISSSPLVCEYATFLQWDSLLKKECRRHWIQRNRWAVRLLHVLGRRAPSARECA